MDVRNGRSLSMDSVKFKLGKDFEVPNFEHFVLDYGLIVLGICNYRLFNMGGKLYDLCGVDPQYCPLGKENVVKSLKRYEIN